MPHDGLGNRQNIKSAVQQWDSAIDFNNQSNTYKLIRALLSQADRIDDDLEDVYHAHHIDSASGKELDRHGELINLPRKSGESDNKYRARIKAEFAQAKTETTYTSFHQYCAAVLDTDVANIALNTSYDALPAVVTVRVNQTIFDNLNLTNDEVVDLLGGGVPAGHEVRVEEGGTFLLKSDGEPDTAENGLTSDSINTGGTLAADIV